MGTRRRQVRPRYGRVLAAASSLTVTSVALLGGVGVVGPSAGSSAPARDALAPAAARAVDSPGPGGGGDADRSPSRLPATVTPGERRRVPVADLPPDSGQGRRVVFSESRQRVWLVGGNGAVRRTYPVSGSRHDNLDPGSYRVYSRSLHAVGIDDSGTMRYFVRFTQGDSGAAIGFHDIPVDAGEQVQTVAELGTPTSHGCIRQRRADAKEMWDFASLGTPVVVTE